MKPPPALLSLLTSDDPAAQEQALEMLRCLGAVVCDAVISQLLRPACPRWALAARCLLPPKEARDRMVRFSTLCAVRRLEAERAAGQEPLEDAWLAVERAGMGAWAPRDVPLHWRDRALRWELQIAVSCGVAPMVLRGASIDLEQVPDGWRMGSFLDRHCADEARETTHEAEELIWLLARTARAANNDEALRRSEAAHAAAAQCCLGGEEDLDGQRIEPVPAARTREEWAWQRRLWQCLVAEGREGLSMVYR